MKYLRVALFVLLFIAAVAIGFTIKNFPFIQFNREIKIYEVFNLLLTAAIGVLIPFFVRRWIDDNRQVKNNIIEELKITLSESKRIKEKINFCYAKQEITQNDKDEINYLFEQSDVQFNGFEQLLTSTYETETNNLIKELKDVYMTYWKSTTGGELMSSKFIKISEDFHRRHNEEFMKFEVKIKQAINKIHRL